MNDLREHCSQVYNSPKKLNRRPNQHQRPNPKGPHI